MKKKWILISVAAGLLLMAITSGAAFAWGGSGGGYSGFGKGHGHRGESATMNRVAEIIGVPVETLVDAFTQSREEAKEARLQDLAARVAASLGTDTSATADALRQVDQEMRSEALESSLQAAIASGRLTEEQADAIRADFEANEGYFHGKTSLTSQEFADRVAAILSTDASDTAAAIQQAVSDIGAEALEVKLQEAIADGRLTEEEAQTIREQYEAGGWHGFGKRGKHGLHGGKAHWGRGHHRGHSH